MTLALSAPGGGTGLARTGSWDGKRQAMARRTTWTFGGADMFSAARLLAASPFAMSPNPFMRRQPTATDAHHAGVAVRPEPPAWVARVRAGGRRRARLRAGVAQAGAARARRHARLLHGRCGHDVL